MVRNSCRWAISEVAVRLQERLQVPRAWRDTTAPKLPLRDEFVAELRSVVQFLGHLRSRVRHTFFVVFALHEDVERLVRLGDDLLPMLEVVVRVLEALPVFVRVSWIGVGIISAQMFGWRSTVVDPSWSSDEVLDICARELDHLRYNLDAGRSITDDGDLLVGVIVVVIPSGTVNDVTFEVLQSGNLGP
jgi:hypothetical protein